MTPKPTRATESGRIYLDLQNLARRSGRPTDELHQLYVLECFLERLTLSSYADRFVLKGGVLLAAYEMRRPTRDVDLRADRLTASPDAVLEAIQSIATHPVKDGVVFVPEKAQAEVIRDDDEYSGVRVVMPVQLANARLVFHVDVNVGDPIVPRPRTVDLPRIRGGVLRLPGYPLAIVHAEKVVTMLERGEANTRWRDFADVYLLSTFHSISGDELSSAMRAVADHRGVALEPTAVKLDGYADLAQRRWATWIRKQLMDDRLPNSFSQALAEVAAFADPALAGEVGGRIWAPSERRWT